MRNGSTISKWGNSLAVRIPLAIARQASIGEGDAVTIAIDRSRGIVLQPVRKKYKLSDLVAQISPDNLHQETEWGDPQGSEAW